MTSTSSTTVVLAPSASEWTVIDGLPGVWRRLRTRLAVSACAADGVVVDGRLVDGLRLLRSPADGGRSTVEVAGRRVELDDDGVGLVRVRRLRPCA